MNTKTSNMNRWILTLLLSAGLLLIVGAVPAWAMPNPAKSKAVIKTGEQQPAPIITSQSEVDPPVRLTEYQKRWIMDKSRLKIGKFTRQGGKSFVCSLEAVFDCFEKPRTTWVFLSAGERQSKELMRTAAMHARAINAAIEEATDVFKAEDKTEYKMLEIKFPNGSRILGLPANPDTARGWSANLLLDEFAMHKDSRAIWKALYPSITRGYKIRIVSTPQGKKNKFYEIWTGLTKQIWDGEVYDAPEQRGGWSKHNVTIMDAVAMGLELYDDEGAKIEPEDLRLGLGDDEAWEQEYMVAFLDEATAWLTYDLIETVEDQKISADPSWVDRLLAEAIAHHAEHKHEKSPPPFKPDWLAREVPFTGDLYIGFDVARHRDFAVIWLDEDVDTLYWTRAEIELKKQPFGVQENVLFALMELRKFRRACIDKTGIGEQITERAQERFGASRVEGIDFSNANKEALANEIKKSFEDRKDRIPAEQRIRQSLHSVKKETTSTGHNRFDADRTEQVGHADAFWAKALCVHARSKNSGPVTVTTRMRRAVVGMLKGY
jgi:phage FluMu gp28-like protein